MKQQKHKGQSPPQRAEMAKTAEEFRARVRAELKQVEADETAYRTARRGLIGQVLRTIAVH